MPDITSYQRYITRKLERALKRELFDARCIRAILLYNP